jgi:tetratricopeptide (TPR) repeat protein
VAAKTGKPGDAATSGRAADAASGTPTSAPRATPAGGRPRTTGTEAPARESGSSANPASASALESARMAFEEGEAAVEAGSYRRALAAYERAYGLGLRTPQLYAARGAAHRNLQEFESALTDLDECLRQDRRNGRAYFERAECYATRRETERAYADFTDAIRNAGEDVELRTTAHFRRAQIGYDLGLHSRVIEDATKVLEVNPGRTQALALRGQSRLALGDADAAERDFSDVIRRAPDARAFGNRGLARLQANRDADATTDLERCYEMDGGLRNEYERRAREIRAKRPASVSAQRDSASPTEPPPTGATASGSQIAALMRDVRAGDDVAVRRTLRGGVSANVREASGMTPLMAAAQAGHDRVAETLIQYRADPRATDATGMTALMYAARFGHDAVTATLLRSGSEVNAKDRRGMTALMYAAAGGHRATVQALLAARPDVNARNADGLTAFQLADRANNVRTAELLRASGGR